MSTETEERYGDLPSVSDLRTQSLSSGDNADLREINVRCASLYVILASIFEEQGASEDDTTAMAQAVNAFVGAAYQYSIMNKRLTPDGADIEMTKVMTDVRRYADLVVERIAENEWQEGNPILEDTAIAGDLAVCSRLAEKIPASPPPLS
ncbi:MAG: hypothetical protein ACON4C_10715 [Henriciella sp.]